MWSWLSLWRLTLGLFPCTEPNDSHVGVQLEESAHKECYTNFSVSLFVPNMCPCKLSCARVPIQSRRFVDIS